MNKDNLIDDAIRVVERCIAEAVDPRLRSLAAQRAGDSFARDALFGCIDLLARVYPTADAKGRVKLDAALVRAGRLLGVAALDDRPTGSRQFVRRFGGSDDLAVYADGLEYRNETWIKELTAAQLRREAETELEALEAADKAEAARKARIGALRERLEAMA